jgi:hypothetical protein
MKGKYGMNIKIDDFVSLKIENILIFVNTFSIMFHKIFFSKQSIKICTFLNIKTDLDHLLHYYRNVTSASSISQEGWVH